MRPAGLFCVLLLASSVSGKDSPAVARYKEFFKEEIQNKWATEELAEQRVVMVRGFQKHDVPPAARWLMLEVLAKDKAGDVAREAVRVLSKYNGLETLAEMAAVWEKKLKKNGEARALALQAFGKIKIMSERPFALGLKDRDARVAAAACRAAGAGLRHKLRKDLERLLTHKHRAVRGAACLGLRDLGGEESLAKLFKVFCGDASHRVRFDAWLALKTLTLQPDLPCDPTAWGKWWEKMASEVPEGQPNPWGTSFPRLYAKIGSPGSFFRVPVLADRVCFIIDVSMGMENAWKIDHKAERKKKPADRIPNFFSVKTRWDLVRNYIKDCLKKMPEDTEVAFVFFSHEISVHPDNARYVKNRAKARPKIFNHLDKGVKRSGGTAMYEGLKAGWGFLKDGDPRLNFERGCDTIIFVTDGQPSDGEFKNKPDRLKDEIWRVATVRQIRIHSVGIHNHAFDLCQSMARDTDGLYVHGQQMGDAAEPQDLEFWPAKKKAFEAARKAKRGPG